MEGYGWMRESNIASDDGEVVDGTGHLMKKSAFEIQLERQRPKMWKQATVSAASASGSTLESIDPTLHHSARATDRIGGYAPRQHVNEAQVCTSHSIAATYHHTR